VSICSKTARNGKANKRPSGRPGKDRTKIAERFADERCSQALLDFPRYNRRRKAVAEDAEAAASEASEWDGREREERLAALREEEERGGGRNRRNFFILSCIHSLFFFLPYFLISFLLPPIGYDWRIAGGRLRLDGSGVAPIRRSG